MSYDLMVFDPAAAPKDRDAFLAWYREQTQWTEAHDYNDPARASKRLRALFFDMIKAYPAMNGPHAGKDFDDPKVSDYCIGSVVIYVAFGWSQLEGAYASMIGAARTNGVGFFDVSANDGEVWMPNSAQGFICVHGTGRSAAQPG